MTTDDAARSPHAPALTRRGFLVAGSALGGLALLRGHPAWAQDRVLTVAVQGLPDALLAGASSFASQSIMFQMIEPLVLNDDRGALLPGLAVSWQAEDPQTWVFKLREGVTFHDGQPFTADDVKFTLDYVLAPDSTYGVKSRISPITGVEVVDPMTVRLTTNGPFPTLVLALTAIGIEPRHYVESVGRDGMTAKPVGTGPFVLEEWLPGDKITFTAFDRYWGGTPPSPKLVIRQIPENSTRVASLLAGEVAVAEELPIDLLEKIDASDAAEVDAVESTVGLLLTFDTSKPPFDNQKVRLALNYAIDKQAILDRLMMGRGTLLQGQMLTSNTFGFDPDLKAFPFDPDQAKALLQEAGFGDGFETSITTRSGKYLADVDMCNVIAAMFENVGVHTRVNVVEQGVFSKMTTAHDMGPIHMVGWYSLGDADFATVWFTQASGRAYWQNDEYEKLFTAARSTVDQDERLKDYHRMMQIMHEEVPCIFLFGLPTIYGKSKNLTGWSAPSDKVLRMAKAKLA
jgi:peptide/nickel transport system substrate-binding protein